MNRSGGALCVVLSETFPLQSTIPYVARMFQRKEYQETWYHKFLVSLG